VSVRGERRVPYVGFHTGYKRMNLQPDELIRTICLRRNLAGYSQFARKVGARNAQAIAKICIAAVGRLSGGAGANVVGDVRIALGSVAPIPLRLTEVEQMVEGKSITPELLQSAKRAAIASIQPIDDIRSTAKYRSAVAGNLVAEFLDQLGASGTQGE